MSTDRTLDDSRKKQLEELQKKYAEDANKRALMRQILEDGAFSRVSNIRLANPGLYDQLVDLLLRLAQSGQLKGKITESQLVALLSRLQDNRKESQITFKRK